MTLRIGSLCAGVGGLDLAVASVLDAELAWYAQYEPPDKDGRPDRHQHAARIMAHRFPGVPNHGDITAIDYTSVEPIDVLTAGWPCQDMSLAGKRAGMMPGTRSGLWVHVARAIEALRPPLVLLENVRSLTSAKAHCDLEFCPWCMGAAGGGADAVRPLRALGCVLGDLADLGFDAQWQVLPACDVGAPHRRERCFVLAWPADGGCSRGSRWASAEDAHREPREQRGLAGPGETAGGRPRADIGGRGGALAADPDDERFGDGGPGGGGGVRTAALAGGAAAVAAPALDGCERDRVARGRRPGSAHGGLAVVSPSDARGVAPYAAGVGRGEGRPEPARLLGRPDAALGGRPAAPDARGDGREWWTQQDCESLAGLESPRRNDPGRRGPAPAGTQGARRQGPRPESQGSGSERGGEPVAHADGDGRRGRRQGRPRDPDAPRNGSRAEAAGCSPDAPADSGRDSVRQQPVAEPGGVGQAVVGHGGDGRFDWDATDYGEAIARWEAILGRTAPWPVDDRGRLSQRLTEWMMGLPDGWVTAVPGVPRNAQAKALGNGCVPLQAATALRMLLDGAGVATADAYAPERAA